VAKESNDEDEDGTDISESDEAYLLGKATVSEGENEEEGNFSGRKAARMSVQGRLGAHECSLLSLLLLFTVHVFGCFFELSIEVDAMLIKLIVEVRAIVPVTTFLEYYYP
jgi:hypothetical protein